jgi:hypothetical protein
VEVGEEIHILTVVRATIIPEYLSPSQICDSCSLLRVRKLDMEMPPDTLEDFLTKTTRVSAPSCTSTSSLPYSILLEYRSADFGFTIFMRTK